MFHEAYLVPKGLEMVSPISDRFKHLGGPDTDCPGMVMSLPCWNHLGFPQEGVGSTRSQRQGDKHLCLWKVWATLLSNSWGTQQTWDQEQRLLKVFLAVSPCGSEDGCDDLQQPYLSQKSEVGISSHHLQPHMTRRPVSAALWCVRASPFSGSPHLLEAPVSCRESQLLCKKWAQSSNELLWFLNWPRFLSHVVLLLAQLSSAAGFISALRLSKHGFC